MTKLKKIANTIWQQVAVSLFRQIRHKKLNNNGSFARIRPNLSTTLRDKKYDQFDPSMRGRFDALSKSEPRVGSRRQFAPEKLNSQPNVRENTVFEQQMDKQAKLYDGRKLAEQAVQTSKFSFSLKRFVQVPLTYLNKRSQEMHKKRQRIYYVGGSFVFIFALVVSMRAYSANEVVKNEVEVLGESAVVEVADEQGIEQGTGERPAETPPSLEAIAAYTTPPDKPRRIYIPALSLKARIKQLGVTSEGAVDAPHNIHDVGWFDGTIMPGSKNGVSLLLGHVSGTTAPGIFKDINKLVQGDEVEIETGNGTMLKYSVEKIEEYHVDKIDMSKILYEVAQGEQSLRLMTCSGNYDAETHSYDTRVVVYTKRIN